LVRLKSLAKVAKTDKKKQPTMMPKIKGLVVLSEVALTEAEQLKLATKRSKTQFHSSHASGSSDGVDTQSKVLDEQHLKTTDADEETGDSGEEDEDDENDSEDESDGDDDDANSDDNQEGDDTNDDDEETDKEKIDDEETMDEEEDDEVTKELYDDVNVNLGNKDTNMTNTDQGASEQQNVSQESGF
ncbi:hypothetical protein Tco_1545417, partial [Tanacetum coccineum]